MGQPAASPVSVASLALRGTLIDCVADPFFVPEAEAVRYFADGLLVIENGHIAALGHFADLHSTYVHLPLVDYSGHLITPGFIDTHIHYPQTGMMAAYGEQLLEWLNQYTFPTERQFQDPTHARQVADVFLDELLKNGTTTALVFAAVFPESVDALFEAALARNLRMISGKVLMDCNAPDYLRDTAQTGYDQSKALIEKWHGKGRLRYAVTPRFAGTSTEAQLKAAAKLLDEFPDVYLHTHLSENINEVAWIRELFPQYDGYLDVYDQTGLVRERSVFAHGVQLTDEEFRRLAQAKATISFCPTSNLFLGSGLFRIEQAKSADHPVKVGLGTDVGAGTSFSMLQTTNEAYKVAQLRGQKLSAFKALFLATLGGAQALCLEDTIGSFNPGNEADCVVLNPQATPLLALRNQATLGDDMATLADTLFSLLMMGDDRAVAATYVLGQRVQTGHTA
ncbi:guanine deaminase [Leptolyngbya sp. BL0902]|uniref:guanine deaminase n=1 Tax=Leptolyngbya sp. BL0902 TaxID=1115757 RepID=UPI0018E7B440|nr:guanine deaminase [Leptolyngbya sp. BL0902]QQE63716.1 guanine deaminase [Leptolyngbya sp. BL0902]